MQLKRYRDSIDQHIGNLEDLALTISDIKNTRLTADYSRLGLKDNTNIYHYVTRDKGLLTLSETSYPLVDINNLKPEDINGSSFTFSDGLKQYNLNNS